MPAVLQPRVRSILASSIGALPVAALLLTLSACGAGPSRPGVAGDCTARLELRGSVYTFRQEAVTAPPTAGEVAGVADVLDCDGNAVDTAVPVRIEGVPVGVAFAVVDVWPGVYVAEGSDPDTWPDVLRQ